MHASVLSKNKLRFILYKLDFEAKIFSILNLYSIEIDFVYDVFLDRDIGICMPNSYEIQRTLSYKSAKTERY